MRKKNLVRAISALVLTSVFVAPTFATTLVRMDLNELVTTNQKVLLGEVVDTYSYWNRSRTFIFTDVRIEVVESFKGSFAGRKEIEITLMGGTVGDLSALILAGAELVPGNSYLLFLDEAELPGGETALTVRDHSQGIFDVEVDPSLEDSRQLRAVSQANDHPLLPDHEGLTEAPGGTKGVPLEALIQEIRSILQR